MNAPGLILSDLGQAALDYAARGWRVFPCVPGGKAPISGRGFHDATADQAQIVQWWTQNPGANIGLALAPSGLVAVDADLYKPDCEWPHMADALDVPETLRQRSARGGVHYIFAAPAGAEFDGKLCGGVDIKHAGYILLEPSRAEGGQYLFETDDDPAPAPEWIPRKGARPLTVQAPRRENFERMAELLTGAGVHDNSRDLIASLVARGVPGDLAGEIAAGAILAGVEPGARRDQRLARIPYHVATAVQKFAPQAPAERASRFFSAAELDGKPVPPREWLVHDLIPHRNVTLLGGDGGTGKSLLALQLAVSAVLGCAWVGRAVAAGSALVLSAEDDQDEMHRRLADIARGTGRRLSDLGALTIRSLAGEDALLAIETAVSLTETALFEELARLAEAEQPRLIVLDTLADLYPANENERAKVRQFVGILRRLALRGNCAVLLLGHPSLTGLSSGSGTSGSTAWNNSVRSRLYLERVEEGGYEPDPDRRKLTTKKANYGRVGGEILMRWVNGVFVPEAQPEGLDALAMNAKAERVFLKLLRQFTAEGRRVNHAGSGSYAPKQFSEHPDREGVGKKPFAAAMNALLARGVIKVAEEGPPSRRTKYLREVAE